MTIPVSVYLHLKRDIVLSFFFFTRFLAVDSITCNFFRVGTVIFCVIYCFFVFSRGLGFRDMKIDSHINLRNDSGTSCIRAHFTFDA